ncbi:MAG TPA: acyl-CoA thioesterase [Actinomycetes bacterium]|nr:acyl-CoA thioesterase [Actinomycetes bacterium]
MARHTCRCPLRWSDMDAYGHVNNVAYLVYLEQARISLFDAVPLGGLLESGVVVVKHEIHYRRPLVYRSRPVPIDIWVDGVSRRTWTFRYVVREDDGTVYARASTLMAAWERGEGVSRSLTDEERMHLLSLEDEPTPS